MLPHLDCGELIDAMIFNTKTEQNLSNRGNRILREKETSLYGLNLTSTEINEWLQLISMEVKYIFSVASSLTKWSWLITLIFLYSGVSHSSCKSYYEKFHADSRCDIAPLERVEHCMLKAL